MKFIAMSDLHLSKKPWQVRKALKMGKGADAVLLVGDLTNDGTPEQMALMRQCIAEVLPDTPVFAVTGNHDYPHQPSPMIREGICDYPALQDWLLDRQPHPYILDDSGAWVVRMGEVEIIGLNCVWHWRRFKFKDGAQLNWLENYLDTSEATWHIILCHAPLLVHNPKRSDTKPYLSRDERLQRIVDAHKNIIFISGHTHVSMENVFGGVEYDNHRDNYYINDGSIRPTTLLTANGLPEAEPADGNIVELDFEDAYPEITGISVKTGDRLSETIWGNEFNIRQQYLLGKPDPEQRPGDGRNPGNAVPANRIRGSQSVAGKLDEAAGAGSSVPAHAISEDFPAGNPAGAGTDTDPAAADSAGREAGSTETGKPHTATGWEREREIFLRYVQNAIRQSQSYGGYHPAFGAANFETDGIDRHSFGGAVSLGLRGAAALGRVAEAESDDPEERKRKQEAQQAASNLGAVIGLTVALVGSLQADNKKQKQEEVRIQEEEEYQEFLSQMEADPKYEEQNWQQTM